jgi:hypothetical protein
MIGAVKTLLEDFALVHAIAERKRLIRRLLLESKQHCRSGLWYVEGRYARHRSSSVPRAITDAVRGIRKRWRLGDMVEKALPPWHAHVPAAGTANEGECSIAYLSKRGDWKLFDLSAMSILSRPIWRGKEPEVKTVEVYANYFHVPASEIVRTSGRLWRREQYVGDTTLMQCSNEVRVSMLDVLFEQYKQFAESQAIAPSSQLTSDAISTMLSIAPDSIPSRIVKKHEAAMRAFGGSFPLVPAHGDLSGQNVLVFRGKPWIIDWESAGRSGPVLYDLLYLFLREAEFGRLDLLEAFLHGTFDARMCTVLAVLGVRCPLQDKVLLLVYAYLITFYWKKTLGERDAGRRNVDVLWNPLIGYCRNHL